MASPQVLKDLPFRHIAKIASLFEELANDCHTDYRSPHRPDIWQQALVTAMPKEAGAAQLSKFRPISLMVQLQKVFTRWLPVQCRLGGFPMCGQVLVPVNGWGKGSVPKDFAKVSFIGNGRNTVSRVLFRRRELTEFCGKLGDFCEKLGEFAISHK